MIDTVLTNYLFCGIIYLQQKKRELMSLSEADRLKGGESQMNSLRNC